jgi:hypothetical protein
MKRWDQRPFEVRNLFNPAFCGVILFRALQSYEKENHKGMPFSLSLLILPLCLYKDSRETIIAHPRGYLLKTIEANPQLLVGFADRVSNLIPYAFEALGLLMERGCFIVSDEGRLQISKEKIQKAESGTSESIACQRVARILGKEFARVADRVTIYTTFGIRP